jgi:Spy/CpxP family protein refolding chaperone
MYLMRSRLTFAGICLALAGAPLVAQQPGPAGPGPGGRRAMPQMAGMPMMDCPMLPMMMNGPTAALRAGSALGISADQRTRIEAIQRQLDAASKPSLDSMQVIHARFMVLAQQTTLDERGARAAFDRMGRVHTAMGVALLRAAYDVAAILTPAQRDSLSAIGWRQKPRPGEMPMCGFPMSGMPMHPMPGRAPSPKR